MLSRRVRFAIGAVAVLFAACGEDRESGSGDQRDGRVAVLAAASLTGAFGQIESAFEASHAGIDVDMSFDGSARLATAIVEGVPADVFASADEANLQKVVAEGATVGEAVVFATNVLQIVVPADNPLGIDSLSDLASPAVTLSLCAPEVPCRTYTDLAFERAGLAVPPAGDQDNVKGVLTQVLLGEADAGLVYLTDVRAAEGVVGIDLAPGEQVEAAYPASVLAGASNPEAAAAFIAFLTGDVARAILRAHGFGVP